MSVIHLASFFPSKPKKNRCEKVLRPHFTTRREVLGQGAWKDKVLLESTGSRAGRITGEKVFKRGEAPRMPLEEVAFLSLISSQTRKP